MLRSAFLCASLFSLLCLGSLISLEDKPTLKPSLLWKRIGPAPADHILRLTVAVKLSNAEDLERTLLEVSDPFSEKYGMHLSIEELGQKFGPSQDRFDAVSSWLSSNGAFDIDSTSIGHFITASIKVSDASRLFSAQFASFANKRTNQVVVKTKQYFVSPEMAQHIDFIGGLSRLPLEQEPRILTGTKASDFGVTPATIRNRYNVTDVGKDSKNSQAVHQFLKQYYSPNDLDKFFNKNNIPKVDIKVVGPNKPNDPGVEASLDIQYIFAGGENIPTQFWFTDGYDNNGQEPFLEWIVKLSNTTDAPLVNSVSYGDDEPTIPLNYLNRMEQEFMMAGSRGLTMLFASGDSGVGCKQCTRHVPGWPASSRYVTAVGGTEPTGSTEAGVGFSGGGFSDVFPRPSYQNDAVNHFLSSGSLPPSKFFNNTGRAYPDISLFAVNYLVYVHGFESPVDGTSCATPGAAGIIALLNDQRLQAGKSGLGFLNPWLYSVASKTTGALFDVTSGDNSDSCCTGFKATSGFDPVTGLGTLNYAILKTIV